MKSLSSLTLAAALVAGSLVAAPALSQAKKDNAAQQKQRQYKVSKEALKPIQDLQNAVKAKDTANFATLLAAAEAVAKSNDEKYLIAHSRLQHAVAINDNAAIAASIQAVLATGSADAAETARLNQALSALAVQNGDPKAAETFFANRLAANPNDLDAISSLARAKLELKKESEALELLQRGISVHKASGTAAPEAWYRMSMQIANRQKNRTLAVQMARETLSAYPTRENLQNLIAVYGGPSTQDKQHTLDYLRLLRQARLLTAGGYEQLGFLLNESGLPGEAKDALEEGSRTGVAKGPNISSMLASATARIPDDRASLTADVAKARTAPTGTVALRTANALLGYGDYAQAIELYRAALSKGGVDADLVNTRLGIAFARAGRKAEAEAAFKAVTGPRAELASLWLAWLAQPAA